MAEIRETKAPASRRISRQTKQTSPNHPLVPAFGDPMLHPDLATLLKRRLEVIADHSWRDRDAEGHFEALKEVSESIMHWHSSHQGSLPARLEHFLSGCSYDKALRFLESDGQWLGH